MPKIYHLECAQVKYVQYIIRFSISYAKSLIFYEVLSKEQGARFPISHKKEAESDESKDDI
jgi:hypothetical protein